MSSLDRRRAHSALRLVLAVALGGTAGCEATTDAYCDVFPQNRFCCERLPFHAWEAATHTCQPTPILGS